MPESDKWGFIVATSNKGGIILLTFKMALGSDFQT